MKLRIVASLLALATVAPLPTNAQPEGPPALIIRRMLARNPALRSFQARVHVDVRMLNFPFYSPKLEGMSYFKRPDNYEVVFARVPPFAHGFDHFFSDLADPSTWAKRFTMSFEGVRMLNGRRMLELRLSAKVRGMIDHQSVLVDSANDQVAQVEWHYYNGGVITMTQKYRNEGNYNLLSSQHAAISIPHVRAIADAVYSDYRTNVAVDDAVFSGTHR